MREDRAAADREVRELAASQAGVLSRRQALDCGLSVARIRWHLSAGRWQRVGRGAYATFSGPLPRTAELWASVLSAGPDAMLSHATAAELWGLTPPTGGPVHVTVPGQRRLSVRSGVVIHRSIDAGRRRHPTRTPPRTRLDDTVIDLTQTAPTVEDAIGWLARAVGGRFTTAARLRDCLQQRPKVRRRAMLSEALRDVGEGCHSVLELRYLRDVERAHRLPRSQRQVRRADAAQYDDVRYPDYRTRVELDGRAAHPEHERWRDMRRDNAAVVGGDQVLRFGSGDVASYPCRVAGQVATVLSRGGWRGEPRRCGRRDCELTQGSS